MDNSVDLPGYKYYLDARTAERPAVFVTFVNLVPDGGSGGSVNGILFPATAEELAFLDARERNYVRREVRLEEGGRAWVYVGSDDARERYESGVAAGTAVASREYVELVRSGFAALGEAALRRFDQSTDPPEVPVRSLRRVDLARDG